MKITLSSLALFISGIGLAQGPISFEYGPSDLKQYPLQNIQNKDLSSFWTNNFDTPSDWLFTNQNSIPGNWSIGTSGPAGPNSSPMGVINSTSGGNFALYDSDAQSGGSDQTTQNALLSYNGSVNCSGRDIVAISFSSYLLSFNEDVFVECSSDSINWISFQVHSDLGQVESTLNPEIVTIDLSTVAANQSEVYLRFRFTGNWDYAWMIDDVSLNEVTGFDQLISDLPYSFYNIPRWIPKSQLSDLPLSVEVYNNGQDQFTLALEAEIAGIYNELESFGLDALQRDTIIYASPVSLTNIIDTGEYSLTLELISGVDDDLSNNNESISFKVTDSIMGFATNPTNFFQSFDGYNFGQKFVIRQDDSLRAISTYAYFGENTVGEDFILSLYSADVNGNPGNLLFSTLPYQITSSDTGVTGSGLFSLDVPLNNQLIASGEYVVVFSDTINGRVSFPFSNQISIPGNSIYVPPGDSLWYDFGSFFQSVFNMYLKFKSEEAFTTNTDFPEEKIILSLYPNPVNNYLNINIGNGLRNRLESLFIFDINGVLVRELVFNNLVNIEDLSSGLYTIKAIGYNGKSYSATFVKD